MIFNIFAIAISTIALVLARVCLPNHIKSHRWGSVAFFGFICAVNIANIALSLDKIVMTMNFSISHRIVLSCCIILALTAITVQRTMRGLRSMNDTEAMMIDLSKLEEGDEIIITFKKL